MNGLSTFALIMSKCWAIWTYDFTIFGITFNLFSVAIVSVGVWVGSMLWTGIVEGGDS